MKKIRFKHIIEDIESFQTGALPSNAVKIDVPQSVDDLMKRSRFILISLLPFVLGIIPLAIKGESNLEEI